MTSFSEMTRKHQAVDLKPRLDTYTISHATCVKCIMVKVGVCMCRDVQHV